VQGYLRCLGGPLATWSAGYQSLRQVTGDDVADQLAEVTGATRRLVLAAMRSLFKTLKARSLIFADPTAAVDGRHVPPPPGLALGGDRLAGLLGHLARPEHRLIVLLVGVHALRPAEVRTVTLDDVDSASGTLLVAGHRRPVDDLIREHLVDWLASHRHRWPMTANPYLLVNASTAGGMRAVSRGFIQAAFTGLGFSAQDHRVDRFVHEAEAGGGDPMRLTSLFGVSDQTAIRYCSPAASDRTPG
jgi:integrase